MEKYYRIAQPPLAEKYTFLVDEITANNNYGLTNDIEKINYNRKILGESFNIEIKISLLLTEEEGSTFVFALGYFIVVLELQTDQKLGRMAFYHCMLRISRIELFTIFSQRYDASIAIKWIEVYNFILDNLGTEKDIVQIHRPKD